MTILKTDLYRLIDINMVRQHGHITLDVRANNAECAALTKRLGVLDIHDLNAYITLSAGARPDLFKVEGDISAEVVQECCVTLAPVEERIVESFAETLTTLPAALMPEDETDEDVEKPVELIQGDSIDIGDIVIQWLALTLNPFPRSEVPMFQYIEVANQNIEMQTPFKVLEKIKDV